MGRRCAVTIQAIQVTDLSTDNTKFPILLNEDNTPFSDFETYAKAGLDDLRVYRDNTDTYRCPVEVVSYDTSGNTCEVWTSDIQISAVSDTTFYLRYGEASWSQPAEDASYGQEAVWDSWYKGRHSLNESSGTRYDSTSNDADLTDNNTVDSVTGKIGTCADFDGSTEYLNKADASSLDISGAAQDLIVQAWVSLNSTTTGFSDYAISKYDTGTAERQYAIRIVAESPDFLIGYNSGSSFHFINADTECATDGTFYLVTGVHDASADEIKIYVNGSEDATPVSHSQGIADGTADFLVGARLDSSSPTGHLNAKIDEIRIMDSLPTNLDNWIATDYNNQNSPSTFIVEGTPSDVGGGISIPVVINHLRQQGIS